MNTEKLKEYAYWYYFTYFPSKKRLFDKILSKTRGDEALARSVFGDIEHLVDEAKNIESRINFCLDRNKNKGYIMRNLLSKGYDKTIIEHILRQRLEERGGSLLDESYVRRKVLMYKEKGKSKNFVISHIGESKEDAIIIQSIIEEIYAHGDEENLLKEYQKLQGKFETKKIVEKLLRKGFKYDDVKKYF